MAKATSKPKVEKEEVTEENFVIQPENKEVLPEVVEPGVKEPIAIKEIFVPKEPSKPAIRKEMDVTLSNEERIEAFMEGKNEFLKLNDFLKSLYPIPKFNEPPAYLDKGEMKRMRILLDNMQSHGKLQIKDNGHGKLGNHYYEGEQQYAKFYHIGNLTIEAKK